MHTLSCRTVAGTFLLAGASLLAGCSGGGSSTTAEGNPSTPDDQPTGVNGAADVPFANRWISVNESCRTTFDFFTITQSSGPDIWGFGFESGSRKLSGSVTFDQYGYDDPGPGAYSDWRVVFTTESDNLEPTCDDVQSEKVATFIRGSDVLSIFIYDIFNDKEHWRFVDGDTSEVLSVFERDNAPATDNDLSNIARLAQMREESGVTKAFAIAQFEANFGAIEPGSEWSPDGSTVVFASHAIEDVMSFQDELSPSQLDAIIERIVPLQVGNNGNSDFQASAVQSRRADLNLTNKANQFASQISAKIGRSLQQPIEVVRLSSHVELGFDGAAGVDGDIKAYAIPFPLREQIVSNSTRTLAELGFQSTGSCWIVINEASNENFDFRTDVEKNGILAHEIVHCFQHEMANNLPLWIGEGTANWMAVDLVGDSLVFDKFWLEYETGNPYFDLFSSSYDAIGFWSHIGNSITSGLWDAIAPIYQLTGTNQQRFAGVVDIVGADALAAWPAFGTGQSQWGYPWVSTGVGGRFVKRSLNDSIGDPVNTGEIATLEYKGPSTVSAPDSSYFVELSISGVGHMHWSNSGATRAVESNQTLTYCWEGVCLCGDGSVPAGYELAIDRPFEENLLVALTGSADGTPSHFFEERVISIDEVCDDPMVEIPPTQPSGRDACLVGSWTLDQQNLRSQVKANLIELSPDNIDIDLGVYAGRVTTNINSDGTGSGVADFSITSTTPATGAEPEIRFVISMSGGGSFNWRTAGDRYFVVPDEGLILDTTTVATFGDISIPFDQPVQFTAEELLGASGENGVRYACDPTTLRIFGEGEGSVSPIYRR